MTRVLVVDDDAVVRVALENLLASLDWEVVCAEDVAQALLALLPEGGRYDAVVLDHDLPDGVGTSILGVLSLLQPRARVVLHTGRDLDVLPEGVVSLMPKRRGLVAVVDHLRALLQPVPQPRAPLPLPVPSLRLQAGATAHVRPGAAAQVSPGRPGAAA